MNLMISESATQPASRSAGAAIETIAYGTSDSALGQVLVARSNDGVCAVLLGDDPDDLKADIATRFPKARLCANDGAVRDDLAKVTRFIDHPAQGLHLPLDMRGTYFQRLVWERLRTIPVGRTVSYSELGRWISPYASPRAVARACAANPIALAIPCHRVVRADGDLTGYRWGIERKRELLRREAAI